MGILRKEKKTRIPIFYMKELEKIIKWAIASWYWKDHHKYEQVSLILVAGSGKAKTLLARMFDGVKYVAPLYFIQEDFTTIDVINSIHPNIKDGKRVMATPEMNRLCNHSKNTVTQIFAVLLNILEQKGLYHVKTKSGLDIPVNPTIKLSLIGGITPEVFWSHYRNWYQIGLIDRFIVLTYDLPEEKQLKIIDYYDNLIGSNTKEVKPQKIHYGMTKVQIQNKKDLGSLTKLAEEINMILHKKYLDFTLSKMNKKTKKYLETIKDKEKPAIMRIRDKLIVLCMGKVISEGRDELNKDDIDEVVKVVGKYAKLTYPEVE